MVILLAIIGIVILYWISEALVAIMEILYEIRDLLIEQSVAQSVEFYAILNGKKVKVDSMIFKANENLPVSVQFKDKFGNPASVEGAPSWSGDENLADLEVAPNDGCGGYHWRDDAIVDVALSARTALAAVNGE